MSSGKTASGVTEQVKKGIVGEGHCGGILTELASYPHSHTSFSFCFLRLPVPLEASRHLGLFVEGKGTCISSICGIGVFG